MTTSIHSGKKHLTKVWGGHGPPPGYATGWLSKDAISNVASVRRSKRTLACPSVEHGSSMIRTRDWRSRAGCGFEIIPLEPQLKVSSSSTWDLKLGHFVYPTLTLHLSFGRDTKSRWSLPSGVDVRGNQRPRTGDECVTCRGLNILEKDTSEIKHSCVSPRCLPVMSYVACRGLLRYRSIRVSCRWRGRAYVRQWSGSNSIVN